MHLLPERESILLFKSYDYSGAPAYLLSRTQNTLHLATRMAQTTTLFGTPKEFIPEEESIVAYIERVEVYFKANDTANDKQVPVFLMLLGGKVYSLLRDLLAPDRPDTKTYSRR